MTRYHVNPESGRPNICKAKIKCDFAVDGQEPPHFNNKEEARNYAEKSMQQQYGETSRVLKSGTKNPQKESPTKNLEIMNSKPSNYKEPSRIAVKDGGYGGNAWVGSKLSEDNKYVPTREIAKKIRQDLKEATVGGYLPNGFKYSVTVDNYSGGSFINTVVYGAGDISETHEYDPNFYSIQLKPEYKQLSERVSNLHDAYNYDDSNSQIDYFNRGFYNRVEIATESQTSHKEYETERRKLNKLLNDKKKSLSESDLAEDHDFLEQENNYYNALENYYVSVSYENQVYNTVRSLQKMPTKEEFQEMRKEAKIKASERRAQTRAKHDKRGTRFDARS